MHEKAAGKNRKDVVHVHIGMHKTGSSSIQQSLRGYDRAGVRYADLGAANHSNRLIAAFAPHHGGWFTAAEIEMIHSRLDRELAKARKELIFSGEGLSSVRQPIVEALLDLFETHAREIRVLGYVRDPVSLASSTFQHHVKHGKARFELPGQRDFYRKRLEPWIAMGDRVRLELVAFGAAANAPGGIVADFTRRLGIDLPPERAVRVNESLSREVVQLVYHWNRSGACAREGSDRDVRRGRLLLLDTLSAAFPGRFRLDPGLVGGAIDWRDVDWVEALLGEQLIDRESALEPVEGAVTGETDLLDLRPETVARLRVVLDAVGVSEHPRGDVAGMVEALHRACREASEDEEARRDLLACVREARTAAG